MTGAGTFFFRKPFTGGLFIIIQFRHVHIGPVTVLTHEKALLSKAIRGKFPAKEALATNFLSSVREVLELSLLGPPRVTFSSLARRCRDETLEALRNRETRFGESTIRSKAN